MAIVVGLVDCVLKNQSNSQVCTYLKEVLKAAYIDGGFAAGKLETVREVEAKLDRMITGRVVRALRRLNDKTSLFLSYFALGMEIAVFSSFSEQTSKLGRNQPLSVQEFDTLCEAAATIWGVRLQLFSEDFAAEYHPESELGPIALYKGEANQISLLYDQTTYNSIVLPYETDFTSAECIEDERVLLEAAQELCDFLRPHHSARDSSPSQTSSPPPLSQREEALLVTEGSCRVCDELVQGEPIVLCPGHIVCDSCRVRRLAFGLTGCPVVGCTQNNSSEQQAIVVMSLQRYGTGVLPLGKFSCRQCLQESFWILKAACWCNLCIDCTDACTCSERSEAAPGQECSICKFAPIDPFVTPCGHLFCHRCAWIRFYSTNLCPVCDRECKLCDIVSLPDFAEEVPARTSEKTNLIQALATVLLSPIPCLAGLSENLEACQDTPSLTYDNEFTSVCKIAACARDLCREPCPHIGETMLCNCTKRHCISCLLKAKQLVEREHLPYLCTCGTLVNQATVDKLKQLEDIIS